METLKLLVSAVESKNERDVANLYLKITKLEFVCSDVENGPSFYIFDADSGLYQKEGANQFSLRVQNELTSFLDKNSTIASLHRKKNKKLPDLLKKLVIKIGNLGFIRTLTIQIAKVAYNKDFEKKIDAGRDIVSFRNGIVDLRTGKFRKRTKDDMLSKALSYDYDEVRNAEKMSWVLHNWIHISNDEEGVLENIMRWLGYCLTGETSAQIMMFFVGHSASNGKTTIIEMIDACLPIYALKLSSGTFDKGNLKRHKQFHMLKGVRLAYIEELGEKPLEIGIVKDFVGGAKVNSEVMFGYSEDIIIQAKLICIGNQAPTFTTEWND